MLVHKLHAMIFFSMIRADPKLFPEVVFRKGNGGCCHRCPGFLYLKRRYKNFWARLILPVNVPTSGCPPRSRLWRASAEFQTTFRSPYIVKMQICWINYSPLFYLALQFYWHFPRLLSNLYIKFKFMASFVYFFPSPIISLLRLSLTLKIWKFRYISLFSWQFKKRFYWIQTW